MNISFFIKSRTTMSFVSILLVSALLFPGGIAFAANQPPLKKIPVPVPRTNAELALPQYAELQKYILSVPAAIALGKALFWDMQAGSDGKTACATCHYRAGADPIDVRSRNQLHPGPGNAFQVLSGPSDTLTPANFPFFRIEPPTASLKIDPLTGLPVDIAIITSLTTTLNDITGSQGVHKTTFTGLNADPNNPVDVGTPVLDPIFNVGGGVGGNVRQVTGRNSPSVINAVFNYANFWDGRGNNIFNGVNPFGPADDTARIWVNNAGMTQVKIAIPNASLASQAVGPPLNDVEMSYAGRTFPELGRKMLSLTPLGQQLVSRNDSVFSNVNGQDFTKATPGLNRSYTQMIQAAFQPNLTTNTPTAGGFNQLESNFSLFWGLSIMLYEATLVSDQTPFDRFVAGNQNAMGLPAQGGHARFNSQCAVCHSGAELSNAVAGSSIPNCLFRTCNPVSFTTSTNHLLIRADQSNILGGLSDFGFMNLGLRPMQEDIGRAGNSPFDNPQNSNVKFPLAFTSLALLQEQAILPFATPSLDTPVLKGLITGVVTAASPTALQGSFKTPGLRNVELNAPYFHNGSVGSLLQVVQFYARGGNFPDTVNNPTLAAKMDPIGSLKIAAAQQDMISFLQALTDERVRQELAPFDHPELQIPSGDLADTMIALPATGGNPAPVTLSAFTMVPITTPTTSTNLVIGGTVQDSTATNDMATVEVIVNGLSNWANIVGTNWAFTVSYPAVSKVGNNTMSIIATTPTGSTSTFDAPFVLLPTAIIVGAPLGAVKQNSATISVAAANDVLSYRYSLDGGAFSAGTLVADPIVLSGLAEGLHTLAVIGTAMVGTVPFEQPLANATIASWRVKTIPPVLTVNAVASPAGGATQTITGSVELGVTPEVLTDTGAAAAITVTGDTWSCTLSGLKKGTNNITVSATDIAQNITTVSTSMRIILPDGCFRGTETPDVTDAIKALRFAVNLAVPSAEDVMHGDVVFVPDRSPISAEDALLILRKVVGLVDF